MSDNQIIEFEVTDVIGKPGIRAWSYNKKKKQFEFEYFDDKPLVIKTKKNQKSKTILKNIESELIETFVLEKGDKEPVELAIDEIKEQINKRMSEIYGDGTSNSDTSDDDDEDADEDEDDEDEMSPAEKKDRKAKKQYLDEIKILRQEVNTSGLSFVDWQKQVFSKYQTLKKVTTANFSDAWDILEYCLSVKCVLNIKDNDLPFMGVILAAPSSNKTLILELFRKHFQTYYSDHFTPPALLGNNTSMTEAQLQKKDMIPKMKDNLVITPELAPIFTANEDDLKAVIGKIIRLLDGKGFTGDTGAHGQRGYTETMFTWIGAAVEIPDLVWRLFGVLGYKIYFLRPKVSTVTVDELADDLIQTDFKEKINNVEKALFDYLKTFDSAPNCENISITNKKGIWIKWNRLAGNDQLTANRHIAELAVLLSHLRGTVKVYANKKRYSSTENEDDNVDFQVDNPIIEKPTRAKTILTKLAIGHAISQGRDYFDIRDMPLVFNVGLSSTMTQRVALFKLLIDNGGSLTINEASTKLKFTLPTTRQHMKILAALDLVNTEGGTPHYPLKITLKNEFMWFLSDEYKDITSEKLGDLNYRDSNSNSSLSENVPTLGGDKNNDQKQVVTPNQNSISSFSESFPTLGGDKKVENSSCIDVDHDRNTNTNVVVKGDTYTDTSTVPNDVPIPICISKNDENDSSLYYENFQKTKTFNLEDNCLKSKILAENEKDLLPRELLGPYAGFDSEWEPYPLDDNSRQRMLSFAIYDNEGNTYVKDITNFVDSQENPAEKQLIEWFIEQIQRYPCTFGYATTETKDRNDKGIDSDLKMLYYTIQYYNGLGFNLPQIIGISPNDGRFPYIVNQEHIDLFKVFTNRVIKGIYKDFYNGNGLEDVTKGLLNKEKYSEYTGADVAKISPEERIKYVSEDAKLVYDLINYNKFEVPKLMYAVSKIVGLSFTKTCHTTPSKWWTNYLEKEGYAEHLPVAIEKMEYAGGRVLTAKIGMYRGDGQNYFPVHEYDVTSMYPTQMINHNLSPETVCCPCCESNPKAKVSDEIMTMINEGLAKNKLPPREGSYWICQKYTKGIIPIILDTLRKERQRYKNEDNEPMAQAVKLLMNSLYGLFGSEPYVFDYANYIVAELTTAFGRSTLKELENLASKHNFEVLYGDTDSLYMISKDSHNVDLENKFLEEWNNLHSDIVLEGKRHKALMLVDEKNYIKVTKDGAPLTKGLGGKKSDRPKLFNRIQKQISYNLEAGDKDKLVEILSDECQKLAFGELNTKDLEINTVLGNDPESYASDVPGRVIGLAQNKRKGETITFFKGDKSKPVLTPDQISRKAYLKLLKSTFEKQLGLLEIDFDRGIAGESITKIINEKTPRKGKEKYI